jgi:hypothetical protein
MQCNNLPLFPTASVTYQSSSKVSLVQNTARSGSSHRPPHYRCRFQRSRLTPHPHPSHHPLPPLPPFLLPPSLLFSLYVYSNADISHTTLSGEMAERLRRQLQVLYLAGHESGAGSSPVLIIILLSFCMREGRTGVGERKEWLLGAG